MKKIIYFLEILLKTNAVDSNDARKRKLLNIILIIFFSTIPPTIILLLSNNVLGLNLSVYEIEITINAIIIAFFSILIIYVINKYLSGKIASILFIILLIIICLLNDTPQEVINGRSTIIFTFPIIIGSFLLVSYGSFFVAIIIIIISSILSLYNNLPIQVFPFIAHLTIAGLSWLTASTLEKTIKSLQQTNLELDKRVEKRTMELQQVNKKLQELSLRDPLTGLLNRRYIYDYYQKIAESFINGLVRLLKGTEKRNLDYRNNVMGIYLLDMDNFKIINDTYGHETGDKVLKDISDILTGLVRTEDIIVRWGGEEFLIILNQTNPEYVPVFSKKVINAVFKQKTYISESKYLNKSCSIGCTQYPLNSKYPELISFEKTIIICDLGLYNAKRLGKNMAIYIELNKAITPDENVKNFFSTIESTLDINNNYFTMNKIK